LGTEKPKTLQMDMVIVKPKIVIETMTILPEGQKRSNDFFGLRYLLTKGYNDPNKIIINQKRWPVSTGHPGLGCTEVASRNAHGDSFEFRKNYSINQVNHPVRPSKIDSNDIGSINSHTSIGIINRDGLSVYSLNHSFTGWNVT
jgi:hypothetical protein